ncbi:hypothetical protein HX882_24690 [Pseudomonas gingeri]|uniref:Uncharacterized protein n=1 Tax=Pseudomonas gingeri TaxID=117681 RepID=A0A7Y7XFW8_9PSED|nr:hypothetical protein [Pseudomonas gingeri]NWB99097.1 hypothetical protein [Pseudomonas gingeri]
MNQEHTVEVICAVSSVAAWNELLQDTAALLENPGAHHKALLKGAYALYQARIVDRDGLGDLLKQADGALAYAVEALLGQLGE